MVARVVVRIFRKLFGNAEVLVVPALTTAAIVPFGPLFADHRYLVLAVGAAIAAAALGLIVSPRLPLPLATAASTVAAFAYLAALVFHSLGPSTVWNGVTGSSSALLTATIPAVSNGSFIVLPILLAWVSSFVGVEIALRTRWIVGPALAPLGAFVVALLFTGKLRLPGPLLPIAIIALTLLAAFVRAHKRADGVQRAVPATGGGGRRGAAFGLPTVGVVALVAVGLGAALPFTTTSRRVDLRDRYHPPLQFSDGVTPLAQLRDQLNSRSTTPLFTVRFTGIPAGVTVDRVRVATLDLYDGAAWGTDASFALAGRQLPSGPSNSATRAEIHQDYQLGDYQSPFLPALDRPIGASGSGLAFDRVSGMLATPNRGLAGFRYSVTSEVPAANSLADHQPVRPGNDPAFSVLALAPPQGWPQEIINFAGSIPSKGPYATLRSIADELRSLHFGYNTSARPGHNLGVLGDFLTAPSAGADLKVSRVGYAEQFAAAFAVLARVKGYPSRVAVGYKVDPEAASKGAPVAVLPNRVHAWAEVDLNGIGWVIFDPTNTTPRDSAVQAAPPPPPLTSAVVPPPPQGQRPLHTGPRVPSHHERYWWLLAIPAIAVLAPILVVVAKFLRRRRRARAGPPATRVVGAWLEARDRLRAYGAPVSHAMTVDEAARLCHDTVGSEAAARVAEFGPVVNGALYAPFEPSEQEALAAWQAEASLRVLLRAQSSMRRRLLAAGDPRPFIGVGGARSGVVVP
jgi:hypothetical protein